MHRLFDPFSSSDDELDMLIQMKIRTRTHANIDAHPLTHTHTLWLSRNHK